MDVPLAGALCRPLSGTQQPLPFTKQSLLLPLQFLRGKHPEDPSCIRAPCFPHRSPQQGAHPSSLPTCLYPSAPRFPWDGHVAAGPRSCHALRALVARPSPCPQNCLHPAAAQIWPWAPPLPTTSDTGASVASAHVSRHGGDRQDGAPMPGTPQTLPSSLQQRFPPGTRTTQLIFPITSTCQGLLSQFPRKTVLSWGLFGAFSPPLPPIPKGFHIPEVTSSPQAHRVAKRHLGKSKSALGASEAGESGFRVKQE